MKNEIEKFIKENYIDLLDMNYGDLASLVGYLAEKELYSLVSISDLTDSNDDYWLQADYHSEKLGTGIVIEYDVARSFESVDDLIEYLESLENRAMEIENRIVTLSKPEFKENEIVLNTEIETENGKKYFLDWTRQDGQHFISITECVPENVTVDEDGEYELDEELKNYDFISY